MDREHKIVELVQQIIRNSSLFLYSDLWSKAGFRVTPNYATLTYPVPPIQFSETPLSRQVEDFRPREGLPQESAAWRLVDLLVPLLIAGQYRNYFDLWAKAGFHVTPIPTPRLKHPEFRPNLFVLGAAKSGTTTIYAYLRDIPFVCMSNPKEPFFFEAEYELGLDHYRQRYFSHWDGEPVVGEARHRNLYLPFIARRIYAVNPQAKLIICVRNPIDRAYSHWWHWYSQGVETLGFELAIQEDLERIRGGWCAHTTPEREIYYQTLDGTGKGIYRSYVDSGYYDEQISRYLEYFPLSQLKIVLFDDLRQDLYSLVKDLEAFIGVDHYQRDNFLSQHVNPALPEGDRLRAPISTAFRGLLRAHYREHNAKLEQLLHRDLGHWQ